MEHARPNSAEQQSVVSSQQQHHVPLIGAQTFPLLTSIPAPASLSTSLSSVPAPLDTVPTSSLRLGQLPSLQLKGQGSDASGAMDRDALAKAELRRARRSATQPASLFVTTVVVSKLLCVSAHRCHVLCLVDKLLNPFT